MNREINITRMETAARRLNERITPERTNQAKAPTHEKILLRDKRSAYSEGSALFIMYESDVTSLNSLMIPYRITDIKRRRIFRPELRKNDKRFSEFDWEADQKIK